MKNIQDIHRSIINKSTENIGKVNDKQNYKYVT